MVSHFLTINFTNFEKNNIDTLIYRNKPFSNSDVFQTTIENGKLLTSGNDVKTIYQLDLLRRDIEYDFLPGDTIAILPQNNEDEVMELLLKLNYEADSLKSYKLGIRENTTKKNPTIPKHIPITGTVYDTFLNNIDIRSPPKKLFLKQLIQYTTDHTEKELLGRICSPAGSSDYLKLLTDHKTLLSLFKAFPSCMPPIELILEYSSPLQPRYFSIASSPLEENVISIVFYVLEHADGLKGICTGWLEKLINGKCFQNIKIPFYFRKPSDFRFNVSLNPNILIATGTGIAPFLGFLQHKKLLNSSSGTVFLFYGCRYENGDFLKKDEITSYVMNGTLEKLYTAFSRQSNTKVYVQHKLIENGCEIVDLLLNKEATLFICGDINTSVKSVKETIVLCLMEHENMDRIRAEETITKLIKNKKYLVDSWI